MAVELIAFHGLVQDNEKLRNNLVASARWI